MGYCVTDEFGRDHILTWAELERMGMRKNTWSTEDQSSAREEANNRFGEWIGNSEMDRFGDGCLNGFLLGAEWMKNRMAQGEN